MMKIKEIAASGLRAAANAMSRGGRLPMHMMFANDERSISGNFCIYVLFSAGTPGEFSLVKANLAAEQPLEFPTLTQVLPAAAWHEREIHDLFGLKPSGHPDLRPLVLHGPWQGGFPMRKDYKPADTVTAASKPVKRPHVHGEGIFEVPVGPIHAGIIEPGNFRFSQAGENVIQLDPTLFFTHRGVEKSLEGLSLEQAVFRAERTCGACSASHALCYSQAAESLTDTPVPVRARYIRVIVAELERLYNHIGDAGNMCAGVGFATGVSHGARMKESLLRFNEELTGNRFLRGMIVPGGVSWDISGDLSRQLYSLMNSIETDFNGFLEVIGDSAGVKDRFRRTGILPRQAAAELGVVGPAARASGVDADLRRDHPYSDYDRLKFAVPVRTHGDVEDRFWLRALEVKESLALVRQALNVLNEQRGAIRADLKPAPAWSCGLGWSESARGANFHWVMLDDQQKIFRYAIRSASYPNWPALPLAVPGNIIPDFPLINKSFELCYACLDR